MCIIFLLPHNTYINYRLQWIEILGTRYKPGGTVVLSVEEDYTFGLISGIIVFSVDDYYIVYEELYTDYFNSHLHAYEVSHDGAFICFCQAMWFGRSFCSRFVQKRKYKFYCL